MKEEELTNMKRTLTIILTLALLLGLGTVALANPDPNELGQATINLTPPDGEDIVVPTPDHWGLAGGALLPFGNVRLSNDAIVNLASETGAGNRLALGVNGETAQARTGNVQVQAGPFGGVANPVFTGYSLELVRAEYHTDLPTGSPGTLVVGTSATMNQTGVALSDAVTIMSITNARMYEIGGSFTGVLNTDPMAMTVATGNAQATIRVTITGTLQAS